MSLDELIKDSSQRVQLLERAKGNKYEAEKIRQRAVDAAIAEAKVFDAEKQSGISGQDLAITLISQASCLVDASRIKEALETYHEAWQFAEKQKLRDWITGEMRHIRTLIDQVPDDAITNQHEYRFVERPFLDQLEQLGWEIIDQGLGVPQKPAKSRREDFREIVLKQEFFQHIRRINTTADGREWLNDAQLETLYDQISNPRIPGTPSLLEINEYIHKLLFKASTDRNELTGESDPDVTLIDFANPSNNHFLAINQFRIDTPYGVRKFIIPDIVLFINGIPLAVVECKESSIFTANPMYEAFRQLQRYSEQREETRRAGLREGDERLFYSNLLMIRSTGERADFGSISCDETHYYSWKTIWPESLKEYRTPLGKEREQEVLIQGMLSKSNLLDLLRCCTVFMDYGKSRIKVVARYQQFRAMQKIIERLRKQPTASERSGVIWHTQGSGKSLTMVFVIRKLRTSSDLKDYKVILVNDRVDLEEQLEQTATLSGETPQRIASISEVRRRLATDTSNLNLVMVHKFQERDSRNMPHYLQSAQEQVDALPVATDFGIVNPSDRILIMVDEAHRTQRTGLEKASMSDNLFDAFPNATRIAFTGTPIIKDEKRRTTKRFGDYIDQYKLMDAVEDGATLQILYEGRAADTAVNEKSVFDSKFIDLFQDRSDQEIALIRKRYGTTGDVFEAEARIQEIADDLVDHYISHILPNGFKAQVVSNSKLAAARYEKAIQKSLAKRLNSQSSEPVDQDLKDKVSFLKTAVVLSKDETNDPAEVVSAIRRGREMNAVVNFKKAFDHDDPDEKNSGIAFLIVCDMLLTGFDAPIEQVMYVDKKIQDHNLLQAIARVNRTRKGKTHGYIVDYVGLANHLQSALSIYAADDREDIENHFKDINSEVPILESRYQRLIQLFTDQGVQQIENYVQARTSGAEQDYTIIEQAVTLLEDVRLRADFEVYLKKMMQSMDVILPGTQARPYRIPAQRFGFILAKTKNRYKDDSLNLEDAGEKIRRLINEHLISLGVNPKIEPVELFSNHFIEQLEKERDPRAQASEMEHAIRKHCKIHFDEDPALYAKFSEKLEAILDRFKNGWEQQLHALRELRDEIDQGRGESEIGLTAIEAVFYDRIGQLAFAGPVPDQYADSIKSLTLQILDVLRERTNIISFWDKKYEVDRIRGDLEEALILSDITELENNSEFIVTELTHLAKIKHKEIVG